MSELSEIKKRYDGAYIEVYGDYDIVHIDKRDLDWLIQKVDEFEIRYASRMNTIIELRETMKDERKCYFGLENAIKDVYGEEGIKKVYDSYHSKIFTTSNELRHTTTK